MLFVVIAWVIGKSNQKERTRIDFFKISNASHSSLLSGLLCTLLMGFFLRVTDCWSEGMPTFSLDFLFADDTSVKISD